MDDGDSKTHSQKNNSQIQRKREQTSFLQRYIANVSHVLSPIWVRRLIQVNNGFEWFVLGCRYRFLFNFRLFLVVVYISYEVLK